MEQQEDIVRKAVSKGVSLGTNIIANHTMESLQHTVVRPTNHFLDGPGLAPPERNSEGFEVIRSPEELKTANSVVIINGEKFGNPVLPGTEEIALMSEEEMVMLA